MNVKRRLMGALGAGILMIGVPTSVLASQPPVVPSVAGQGSHAGLTPGNSRLGAAKLTMRFTRDGPRVQQEGQGTYENMLAALGNLGTEIEQLNAMTGLTVTNVRIFDADYLASGHDPAVLDQAIAMHGQEIAFVQSTLTNNEIVRTVLEAVNVPAESVVAIDTLGAGDVAIYYQP